MQGGGDPYGLWTRNTWEGGPRGPYSGKAICEGPEDTLESLAIAITGDHQDSGLLEGWPEEGDEVDISPLLEKFEEDLRYSVVEATGKFNAAFGAPANEEWGFAELEQAFNGDLADGEQFVCDCQLAVFMIMMKGLDDAVGREVATKVGLKPIVFIDSELKDMRLGDITWIRSDADYKRLHPGGAWQAENVIKVGDDKWYGHPMGDKTMKEWEDILIREFNRGLPERSHIDTVPGFNKRAGFWDVAKVGMVRFDHETGANDDE